MNEIDLGEEDVDCTLEKMESIRSNNHHNENDDNTLVEGKTESILLIDSATVNMATFDELGQRVVLSEATIATATGGNIQ